MKASKTVKDTAGKRQKTQEPDSWSSTRIVMLLLVLALIYQGYSMYNQVSQETSDLTPHDPSLDMDQMDPVLGKT